MNNTDFREQQNKDNADDVYFDTDMYGFTYPVKKELPPKNNHKKRNGIIFLTVFSVLFVVSACIFANNEDSGKTPETNNPDNDRSSAYNHTYTDYEIEEKLRTLAQSDDRYNTIYINMELYPESILQAVCRNPEIADFAAGYLTSDGSGYGELTEDELSEDVPLLIQWDSRWGYIPYGDDVIGLSGCGPTCLSMTAISLTGNAEYTPSYVADFAEKNGYYELGSGTMWSLITEGCTEFGLHAEEIPLGKNEIYSSLGEGRLIICSMNPGDFTAVGHFIVISGIESGKLTVNDPNSRERSGRLWSYDELEWQIRNLWALELN